MWSPRLRPARIPKGKALRFVLPEPALIHWGHDGWKEAADLRTEDCGLAHVAMLPAERLAAFATLEFTLDWPVEQRWAGQDFQITIEPA
jgi:glucoamylase